MIVLAVYLLCAATSLVCAVLLFHGHRRSGLALLFWSGLCFAGLAVNNLLLVVDLAVVPDVDLSLWRSATALASLGVLISGLVWEAE
jgi:hypothetical protein